MIITRAMPTQQTAITGVSRRITAGQEFKAGLCRTPVTGIPYWRWENEASRNGGNPKLSALWTAAYFGTDGDPTQGNLVVNGPFAAWQALIWNNTTRTFSSRSPAGIVRRLGRDTAGLTSLPNQAQVTDANTYTTYDVAPYDKTSANFRNRMEGWATTSRMHNQ